MKIAISAESTLDFTKELKEKYGIYSLPFGVLLGDDFYNDGEISTKTLFEFVEKNKILPKTSALNEFQYTEHFEKLKKEYDAVIHFSMSSELSCACSNAIKASKNFENVHVINTKSLSTGIGLLIIKTRKMIDKDIPLDQILDEIHKDVEKLQVSFIVNKLDYLRKGGRCSAIALLGANILKIRPQIVLRNGKMVPGKKYRGNFDNCVDSYCKDTLAEFNNYDDSVAFFTYTSLEESTKEVVRNNLKQAGFKEIIETTAGATISSHCGPNTLGILFLTR